MAADSHAQAPDAAAELERRVSERRARGEYPEELDVELDAHFRRILEARTALFDPGLLHEHMARLDHAAGFSPDRIELGQTSVPGGAALHRAVAKLVSRQTAGVLEQSQEFAAAVQAALHGLVEAIEHVLGRVDGEITGRIDLLLDEVFTPTGGAEEAASLAALVRGVVERPGDALVLGDVSRSPAVAAAADALGVAATSAGSADTDAAEVVIPDAGAWADASELLALLDRLGRAEAAVSLLVVGIRSSAAATRGLLGAALQRSGFAVVEHHRLRGGGGLVVGRRR